MFVYCEHAEYAFNQVGQKKLEDLFLSDFSDDNWYVGATNYLDGCDSFLAKAEAGHPVNTNPIWGIGLMTLLSCLVAGAICVVLRRKMENVAMKTEANQYILGGLQLSDSQDTYVRTVTSRTLTHSDSSDSGSSSGGTSSCSGGGGSGRSGSF